MGGVGGGGGVGHSVSLLGMSVGADDQARADEAGEVLGGIEVWACGEARFGEAGV